MTRTRPPQPQVSVIVPVYNQEQYLEECISSIRRQTLAEWECIIVNDGSSDSSGEIARRFSEEDSRIRCLEQENRGVSSARNLGMRHASGRYLCFVDGDDFIDAAFLKHLLDASDRGASDLTVAGKLFCDRFPPDKIPALPTCGIFLRREFPLKNNLEFPEGIHPCEDGLFSHFVLALTEKISFCPEAVYHYRQHEQGNHHQIRKRTADILPMIPRWLSLIEEFYEQRHLNTLNTVGYKEIYEYMSGNWTLDFAVNMIKQDSRRYAKKQLSWFNRDKEIAWFHPDQEEEIIEFVKSKI